MPTEKRPPEGTATGRTRKKMGSILNEWYGEMIGKITDALNGPCHAILEGETGIGKSMAYLIPAIFYSNKNRCRVCVSTNTINLQYQLIDKDLPFLESIIPFEFKYCLLKIEQSI